MLTKKEEEQLAEYKKFVKDEKAKKPLTKKEQARLDELGDIIGKNQRKSYKLMDAQSKYKNGVTYFWTLIESFIAGEFQQAILDQFLKRITGLIEKQKTILKEYSPLLERQRTESVIDAIKFAESEITRLEEKKRKAETKTGKEANKAKKSRK